MAGESFLQLIDQYLDQLFLGWNIYSTCLAVFLLAFLFAPLFLGTEPDVHPMLLARQSTASPVRQPGETAIYRALDAPHGYPLRSGLNVKDPGAPRWSGGRDGDLRDIWIQALKGSDLGGDLGPKGRIISTKGIDTPVSHELEDITRQINLLGAFYEENKIQRVAIYLPNSVEFLVALYAGAFYGVTPILIPHRQSLEKLQKILRDTKADGIIAPAGKLSLQDLSDSKSDIKNLIVVVEETSRHMDWQQDPHGGISITQWHDIIGLGEGSSEPPARKVDFTNPRIVTIWKASGAETFEIIEFEQQNIVAAVAAQVATLHRDHRIQPSDLMLPIDSLTSIYPLTLTLSALFSNASVALITSAGPAADYEIAFQGTSPSIIVASSETISNAHAKKASLMSGLLSKLQTSRRLSSLAAGSMKTANTLLNHKGPRLIYTYERTGCDDVPLSPKELSNLRILTGARIVYALVASKVAGAVAQTNMMDYRRSRTSGRRSHFGPPLSSVEVKLVETPQLKITDDSLVGNIVVSGPAVVSGEADLGVVGHFQDDNTLALL